MMSRPNIIVAGILDTKGREIRYIAESVSKHGGNPLIMELSLGKEIGGADISLDRILDAEGYKKEDLFAMNRKEASDTVSQGAAKTIKALYEEGKVQGVIATGGSMGTNIATFMMQALPIGIPKIMLSSDASGDCSHYIGTKDIAMLYPICEAGLNKISRKILDYAAAGITAMAAASMQQVSDDKTLVGCMMFGCTTPCILRAESVMNNAGKETIINHCTGAGGKSMEEMIADGLVSGILDLTTQEVTADVFDTEIQQAGPDRLRNASRYGIPQVIAPGGAEQLLFEGEGDPVPQKIHDDVKNGVRNIFQHNPTLYLTDLTLEEIETLGEEIGNRLSASSTPTVVCIPMRGWDSYDCSHKDAALGWVEDSPGPFWKPSPNNPLQSARAWKYAAGLKKTLPDKDNFEVLMVDKHINEKEFADVAAEIMLEMLEGIWTKGSHTELEYVESY